MPDDQKRFAELLEANRKQKVIDSLLTQVDSLQEQIGGILDGPRPAAGPRVYTALELYDANLPAPEGFLAGGVLCRQSLSVIAGRRGVGKTFLLLKLAAGIAAGGYFGPFAVKQGRVLLMSEEMTEGEVQQRLVQMFSRLEVEAFRDTVKIVCRTGVKIDSDASTKRISDICSGSEVLLIDAFSDIKGSIHENDNDEMGAGARRIRDLISVPLGCSVLVAHHMGRPKEDGSSNPRGASALEDVAADICHLGRNREGDGFVGRFEKVRHMSPPGDFGYTIRSASREDGSPFVDVDVFEYAGAATEAEEINRLVSWIATIGDANIKAVQDAMSWTKTTALYHLKQAATLGMLERHKVMGEFIWCKAGQGGSKEVPF